MRRCNVLAFVRQGNLATLNFYLTNFTDVPALQSAIRNIAYLGGWTNTTGALQLMRTDIFNSANGDRPDVPNVAILITDGIPNRDVDKLPGEVNYIKRRGIRIVGVGVTNEVIFLYFASLKTSCRFHRLVDSSKNCLSLKRTCDVYCEWLWLYDDFGVGELVANWLRR